MTTLRTAAFAFIARERGENMIELPVTLTSTGGAVSFASPVPLGYTKNKGVYRLLVTAEGEWEGLTIRCFWHVADELKTATGMMIDLDAVDYDMAVILDRQPALHRKYKHKLKEIGEAFS